MSEIYHTQYLWDDLIAIGRGNGLTDEQIAERLMQIENNARASHERLQNGSAIINILKGDLK